MRPSNPPDAVEQPESPPREIGPTAADEAVQFNVSLNLPGSSDLAEFLDGLSNPNSANYHEFLTATEFGERFGLPQESVGRVLAWLESGGLEASVVPQRTSVAVTGSAEQANRLLGIQLVDWQNSKGDRYHRPSGDPVVPRDLDAEVATILGLDTEPILQPALRHLAVADVNPGGLTPDGVSTAYEIDPLHAAGFHGEGLAIAIVAFATFTPSDIDKFDEQFGLSGPPVEQIRLRGSAQEPGHGADEVSLDIEVIRGIAPQATIITYEGPNTSDGLAAVVANVVAGGRAKILSDSWGKCEKFASSASIQAEQRELAAAFAAGVTVFSASGDNAAYDCRDVQISDDPFVRDLSAGVDWPASSPSVVAVGGTFLWMREDGTYYDEAGWEEPLSGNGGGGGLSKIIDRPTWQQGAGVDNAASNGKRQLPDVAGPADPASGFFVLFTAPGQGLVSGQIGGTSAAAPFWAASMLLASQLAASQGVAALGPIGPLLYQVAANQPAGAVFHDVIRGGNLLYDAGQGWDYSTGLGSPRVAPLAQAIVDFLKR